jgi:hypothetical protein
MPKRVLLFLLFVGSLFASCTFPLRVNKQNPTEEWEVRISIGERLFTKSTYAEEPELGHVSYITQGYVEPRGLKAVVVVGWNKAIYMDPNKKIIKTVDFRLSGVRIVASDLNHDRRLEFLNKGGGGGPVFILDDKGNRRWTYGSIAATNWMASGDINGDGKAEYVVASDDGITIFDSAFHELRQEPDKLVWQVETVDIDGDGKAEIIHNNASGCLRIRDQQGSLVGMLNTVPYIAHFSLCRWPAADSALKFLVNYEKNNVLFDGQGNVVRRYDAPLSVGNMAVGTPVRFRGGKDEYFAIVNEVRATWQRSILYIYSPDGRLIYQEVIPAALAAVYALPLEESQKEVLLVGGKGVVWEYELRGEDQPLQ